MHETIIAKQIIEEAEKHGKPKSITVEVGDLGHLPLEELKEVMDTMVPYKIHYVRKPAKVRCKCGYIGEPNILEKGHDFNIFVCPKCDNQPEILDGKDIILKEVEV
jgi:Zn finger protein HypA/HybF involved in hydrogenase expression